MFPRYTRYTAGILLSSNVSRLIPPRYTEYTQNRRMFLKSTAYPEYAPYTLLV